MGALCLSMAGLPSAVTDGWPTRPCRVWRRRSFAHVWVYKYMCGEGLTKATIEKYNDVKCLNAWASSILPPQFKYTSIVVLQNSACPVHADKNNME
eukprot:COSAG01_NODE_1172_length_11400_cov_12.759579_8_plen_96_part_00